MVYFGSWWLVYGSAVPAFISLVSQTPDYQRCKLFQMTLPHYPAQIDLNADLGEGGAQDAELLRWVSSASICCGAHAGSKQLTRRTVRSAVEHGVSIGAHPGYPDRAGFGRRPFPMPTVDLLDSLRQQLDTISEAARSAGAQVSYLKPHGALYHHTRLAGIIAESLHTILQEYQLPLLHQAPSYLLEQLRLSGASGFREAFIDRAYDPQGDLIPRGMVDANLTSPEQVAAQLARLLQRTDDGFIDSFCVHGDGKLACEQAQLARSVFSTLGVPVNAFATPRSVHG